MANELDRATLRRNGPANHPARIISVVLRHAQKGPEGISSEGEQAAVSKGQELARSGIFRGIDTIQGYVSRMSRGPATLAAVARGLDRPEAAISPIVNDLLLGYGSADGESSFWGQAKLRLDAAVAETALKTRQPAEKIDLDMAERPVIEEWLRYHDQAMVDHLDPRAAAADAAVGLGEMVRALNLRRGRLPLVRGDVGKLAITHRGALEPLLVARVLRDSQGNLVRDIDQVGGVPLLLDGMIVIVQRDVEGKISADVIFLKGGERLQVDIPRLSPLYKRGIERERARQNAQRS